VRSRGPWVVLLQSSARLSWRCRSTDRQNRSWLVSPDRHVPCHQSCWSVPTPDRQKTDSLCRPTATITRPPWPAKATAYVQVNALVSRPASRDSPPIFPDRHHEPSWRTNRIEVRMPRGAVRKFRKPWTCNGLAIPVLHCAIPAIDVLTRRSSASRSNRPASMALRRSGCASQPTQARASHATSIATTTPWFNSTARRRVCGVPTRRRSSPFLNSPPLPRGPSA